MYRGPKHSQPIVHQFNESSAPKVPAHIAAVNDRLNRLKRNLPSVGKTEQSSGGYLGRASHLIGYTWEGVSMGMLCSMLSYLFKTLLIPADFEEKARYENLDADLRYVANDQGDLPEIYEVSFNAEGKMQLSNQPMDPAQVTEADILANGYMMPPTQEQGLRNRLDELMVDLSGESQLDMPLKQVIDTIKGSAQSKRNGGPTLVQMQTSGMVPMG